MLEIRRQNPEDLDAVVSLMKNAFPANADLSPDGMKREKERLLTLMNDEPEIEFYGLYVGETLIAAARYYRLHINLFGKVVPAAGLGALGVDLAHKKNKLAFKMMSHFESWAQLNDLEVGLLLPFRPDFYKRLGYGFGTTWNEYRIALKYIPTYEGKQDIRLIPPSAIQSMLDYHQSRLEHTHGMIQKLRRERRRIMTDKHWRYVASYDEQGTMEGYFRFYFQASEDASPSTYNIVVDEGHVESPLVLRKLLDFIKKQEDQVNLAVFQTCWENFHLLFENPLDRSGRTIPFGNRQLNTQYIGMMYKIFSFKEAFEQMNWRRYPDAELTVHFEVIDDYSERTQEAFHVEFYKNRASLTTKEASAHIKILHSDFSSLFMGTVSFRDLIQYTCAAIDDASHIDIVDRIFTIPHKPASNSNF